MKKSNLLGVADTGYEARWDEDWNDIVGQGGWVLEKNNWKKQIHGKVDQVIVKNRVVEGFFLGNLVLKKKFWKKCFWTETNRFYVYNQVLK